MKVSELKESLSTDSVNSETIHVGIELETYNESMGGHDDDACERDYIDGETDHINNMSDREILRDYIGLNRDSAASVERYFDADQWRSDTIDNISYDGCQHGSDCPHHNIDRDSLAESLIDLTGNRSIKVESDGSIRCNDNQDAEIVWNYFLSKETVKDNEKILEYLKRENFKFNKSCGLHINLNNYLKLPQRINGESIKIPTSQLDFLFNFVASSRRQSNFCNKFAVSNRDAEKYSMINNQGDRLEFRFFSPTFEAVKLNHYVRLAHHVYKRLAGIDCKLPKKTESYFLKKMTSVNGLSEPIARITIVLTNSIKSLQELHEMALNQPTNSEVEMDEAI